MKPSIFLGLIYVFIFASPAHAYIDPVTGSFLIQAIIGGFAAALVAIRRVREKVLGFFGMGAAVHEATSADENTTDK